MRPLPPGAGLGELRGRWGPTPQVYLARPPPPEPTRPPPARLESGGRWRARRRGAWVPHHPRGAPAFLTEARARGMREWQGGVLLIRFASPAYTWAQVKAQGRG